MSARVLLLAAALLGAAAGAPRAAHAQGDCVAPDDSHEAQTFGILSVPLAFTGVRAPETVPEGHTASPSLGLEVVYLPRVDSALRTSTLCRPGKGPENVNILFALPRPRVGVRLPGGFDIEASWVPPVRVKGVKPNLFGVLVGFDHALGQSGAVLGLRAHATFGNVHAPVTCPDEAVADPNSECYQGQPSDDIYHPNIFGAEAAVGWGMAEGRLRPYGGFGYNHLAPRFQVNFTNRFGVTDNRHISADLDRLALFGGASWRLAPTVALTGEVYAMPADAVTGRLVVRAGL